MTQKTLMDIVKVVANCPRSFNQNVKKIFPCDSDGWDKYCDEECGFKLFSCFYSCPKWNERIECWRVYSNTKEKR